MKEHISNTQHCVYSIRYIAVEWYKCKRTVKMSRREKNPCIKSLMHFQMDGLQGCNTTKCRTLQKSWGNTTPAKIVEVEASGCPFEHHQATIMIFLLISSAFRWPRCLSGLKSSTTCQYYWSVLPGPRSLGRVPKFTQSCSGRGKGFAPLRSKTYPGSALLYLWYHMTWPARLARIYFGKILNTALPFPVFGTWGATEVLSDWPTANRACELLSGPMWRACSRPPWKTRAKFDRENFSPIKKKRGTEADRQCRSRVAPRILSILFGRAHSDGSCYDNTLNASYPRH